MDIRVHFAVRTTPPPDSTVDASVGARKRKRGESIACLDARCTAPCGDRLARTFGLVDTSVCPAIAPVGASDPLAALRRAHPGVPFRATPSGTTQVLRRGRGKSKKKWHRCCRRCKKAPNYNDEEGRPKRLCAAHAHAAGTYAVQKPCRDCPDDAKLQAAYNDEDDQPNRLCATHARAVGTYAVQHPCRDCPDDAKLEAGYNDEDDRPSRLCAAHARAAGTHAVLSPCRDCPDDAKLQAAYNDEHDQPNRLCAAHARAAGTYAVQHPCRDCPDDAKLEAGYNDEDDRPSRLCAAHARAAGTHAVLSPCRDCPDDAKLEAGYNDEDDQPNRLCAAHARAAGTHAVQRPCRDCPDDAKLQASYNDEHDQPNRLCAAHARAAGTYAVQRPCRDCPDDAKLEACYNDEHGQPNRLCAAHAVVAGTHVASPPGASRVACEFFDRWEALTGERVPHIHHNGSEWVGKEVTGLVPGRRCRPDGYVAGTGGALGTVWLFHGNWWHGYPPEHPKHETCIAHGRWSPDEYQATLAQMDEYARAGCAVRCVWGHEYKKTTVARGPKPLRGVVRTHGVDAVSV